MPRREAAGTTAGFADRASNHIGRRELRCDAHHKADAGADTRLFTKLVDLPPPTFERITSEKPVYGQSPNGRLLAKWTFSDDPQAVLFSPPLVLLWLA